MRRFETRLIAVGAADLFAYREYLEQHPEELGELFDAILSNVTGYFRDKETRELVASEVIPEILERKQAESVIRVWSAGCASGDEGSADLARRSSRLP
jgi:two-component system, chemotaxis family, CheB/CheR fusion protein